MESELVGSSVAALNFHHLRYFWAVATHGSLTGAARHLHVAPSALSTQIKQLEAQLGQRLFQRSGRSMRLTEAGHVALSYADSIFAAGNEMMEVLRQGRRDERQTVRIGAVATTSRNFQENFIRPLLDRDDVELVLVAGTLIDLLGRLRVHALDLVLCNQRIHPTAADPWRCRRIARQPVSLVGRPSLRPFHFPDDLTGVPLLLPSRDNEIRTAFDLRCEQIGLRYRLRAEVDDMALLRLLARDSDSVALMPPVVAQDELLSGRLVELAVVPDLYENFYAVTVQRQYQAPLIGSLLVRNDAEILAPPAG